MVITDADNPANVYRHGQFGVEPHSKVTHCFAGSDRYAAGILGRVVRVRNRMNSVFVGLSCRRREEKDFCRSLIQAVRLLMRTGILDIGQWYGMVY